MYQYFKRVFWLINEVLGNRAIVTLTSEPFKLNEWQKLKSKNLETFFKRNEFLCHFNFPYFFQNIKKKYYEKVNISNYFWVTLISHIFFFIIHITKTFLNSTVYFMTT